MQIEKLLIHDSKGMSFLELFVTSARSVLSPPPPPYTAVTLGSKHGGEIFDRFGRDLQKTFLIAQMSPCPNLIPWQRQRRIQLRLSYTEGQNNAKEFHLRLSFDFGFPAPSDGINRLD
jgi:hypothetical protein